MSIDLVSSSSIDATTCLFTESDALRSRLGFVYLTPIWRIGALGLRSSPEMIHWIVVCGREVLAIPSS